jgi:hypothetical protein
MNIKILRIKWTQKLTNEGLCKRVDRAETILQKDMKRKLGIFGHIARMTNDRKFKTLVNDDDDECSHCDLILYICCYFVYFGGNKKIELNSITDLDATFTKVHGLLVYHDVSNN